MGGAPGGSGFPAEMQRLRAPDYDCPAFAGEKYQRDCAGGMSFACLWTSGKSGVHFRYMEYVCFGVRGAGGSSLVIGVCFFPYMSIMAGVLLLLSII